MTQVKNLFSGDATETDEVEPKFGSEATAEDVELSGEESAIDLEEETEEIGGDEYLAVDANDAPSDSVRMYLREIGQVRLLSAKEEHVLARQVEDQQYLKSEVDPISWTGSWLS